MDRTDNVRELRPTHSGAATRHSESEEESAQVFADLAQRIADGFIQRNAFSPQRAAELMQNPGVAATDPEKAYVKLLRETYKSMFAKDSKPPGQQEAPASPLSRQQETLLQHAVYALRSPVQQGIEQQHQAAQRNPSLFEAPRNSAPPSPLTPPGGVSAGAPPSAHQHSQQEAPPVPEGDSRNLGSPYAFIMSTLYGDGMLSPGDSSPSSQQPWPFTDLDVATAFDLEGDEAERELLNLHREYVIHTVLLPCMQLLGITSVSYSPATSSVELNDAGEVAVRHQPVPLHPVKLLEWYIHNLVSGPKLKWSLPEELFPKEAPMGVAVSR